MRSLLARLGDTLSGWLTMLSATALGRYQTATVRIGLAAVWLGVLVREAPHRHDLWGPDAPWDVAMARRANEDIGAFSVLAWHDSALWFELCYLASMGVALALLLGWRTRTTSMLFVLSVMSFQYRNDFVLNAGENILRIMAIYLVFTQCARVWSLDARARAASPASWDRTGVVLWVALGAALVPATALGRLMSPGWLALLWGVWLAQALVWQLRRTAGRRTTATLDQLGNLVHHGGVAAIMVQACLIYAASGWYKIQGGVWQDGTAVYWSSQIDFLQPWPALSDLLTGNAVIVLLLTYGTVLVQVAFPFSLLNRTVKNVFLALLIMEHLGIATLMGLVSFSLTMIAADLIFAPTNGLRWLGDRLSALRRRAGRSPAPEGDPDPGPAEALDTAPSDRAPDLVRRVAGGAGPARTNG